MLNFVKSKFLKFSYIGKEVAADNNKPSDIEAVVGKKISS